MELLILLHLSYSLKMVFWDPDFIDEKYLGRKLGISIFQPDGMGHNLERGGTPYPYKTRTRTFFFRPTE